MSAANSQNTSNTNPCPDCASITAICRGDVPGLTIFDMWRDAWYHLHTCPVARQIKAECEVELQANGFYDRWEQRKAGWKPKPVSPLVSPVLPAPAMLES